MTTSTPTKPRDDADQTEDDDFVASRFYAAAWSVVRGDLLLVVWKLIGAILSSVISTVLGITVAVLLFVVLLAGLSDPTVSNPLVGMLHFLGRPGIAFGTVGVVGTIWLIGLFVDALITGGIWHTLARGARGEEVRPFNTFFAGLFSDFPKVLGLRVMSGVVQTTMVFLLGVVVIALIESTTGFGALAEASRWTRSALWAGGLTAFLALSGLARLAVEVASAPLFVSDRTLGEALLDGARLVAERFLEVYRILIFAGALWLAPLIIYWVVLMGQNLTIDQPELNALFVAARLLAEIVLFVATALISLHLYGAYFFYWSLREGYIDALPSRDTVGADAEPAAEPRAATTDAASHTAALEGTHLADLLPRTTPYVFDVDDLVAHSRHARPDSDESASASETDSEPPVTPGRPSEATETGGPTDTESDKEPPK